LIVTWIDIKDSAQEGLYLDSKKLEVPWLNIEDTKGHDPYKILKKARRNGLRV